MSAALLFDLDGTLVDSHYEISVCVERAFLDMGMDVGLARVEELVDGSPLEDIWRAAGQTDPARFEAFATAYRNHYLADMGQQCALFPAVRETLQALRDKLLGVPFAVVSNKSAPTVAPLLRKLDIEDFFDFSLGCGGSSVKPKPHPESLLVAARELGCEAERCTMIGDTVLDVRAGIAAGMTTVALTYGMGDAASLHAAGAHHVLDDFEVLLSLF